MKERKELWPGGLLYAGDPIAADSLALADFAGAVAGRRAVDLGCGSGILTLLLAHAHPSLALDAIELRGAAAEECRENLRANGLAGRCRVWTGDFRTVGPAEKAELAVSNPPYFPAGRGGVSPDPARALMRTETATLGELCAAAAGFLAPGGAFCLVHRTERIAEVFRALADAGLEPKRLRLLAPAPGRAAAVFLLEARLGAAPGLVTEPTLFQFGPDGGETAEYRRICHWEARP